MSDDDKSLRLDEKMMAEDLLYSDLFHQRDRGIMRWAVGGAILLHVAVLLINFPEMKRAVVPQRVQNVITVKKYVPPPPKVERRQITQVRKLTKKVPIPDPTPDEPEPIREPEPEIEPEPLPPDVEILIGEPEPPPPPPATEVKILQAGVGDVTNPIAIRDTMIDPEYPELARVARITADVILNAVIHSDGSVGDVKVLRSSGRAGMGFEESAIEAVQKWRYQPALQNGRPVDVYFTIIVHFKIE